ncbi:hypothetical protein LX69_02856 [Breznakibacter xylanolyticus]|uniref:Uncharacterized protein n=1 Tax=Breznakibacter xylanolyticus TaxID=990 RepID=A0A2W7MX77_9BACT|nr:hypothetical protein [Breznakibacter xylanolyticus]PZX12765.1 hypothetical protein LX69_02856 [Breznakibacter xylanolyticus]
MRTFYLFVIVSWFLFSVRMFAQESDIEVVSVLKSEISIPQYLQTLVINEIDCDTPGDDKLEFVELYDGGAGNTPLDNVCVVFYFVNSISKNVESCYSKILKGGKTNAEGYFLYANTSVEGCGISFGQAELRNGPNAVALYYWTESKAYEKNLPLLLDGLIDAVVYVSDRKKQAPDDMLQLLNVGQSQVNEASEGASDRFSLQRFPNGGGGVRNSSSFVAMVPTPGFANSLKSDVQLKSFEEEMFYSEQQIHYNLSEYKQLSVCNLMGHVLWQSMIIGKGVYGVSHLPKGWYVVVVNGKVFKFLR